MDSTKMDATKMDANISKKYQKKTQREHLLDRPGMYMGSIYDTLEEVWVVEDSKMVKKNLMYNPGILKLFDEIVMNATDHARDNDVTEIRVTVSSDEISVYNNGPGIPIVKHSEHQVYIPELIFTQFLTSTNYDDDEKRLKAGLNGLGAKITSAFSTKFQVETVSKGQIYTQSYLNNLSIIEPPVIKSTKSGSSHTKITFSPDFARFKVKSISDSTLKILEKRVYDIAICTNKKVNIYFNDTKIKINSFSDYVDLYLTEDLQKEKMVVEEQRWKVAICTSPDETFTSVSFVNGINTMNGGTHVTYVINPVIKYVIDKYQKKMKDIPIKANFLKDNMMIFVVALIENPEFKSQAKEELTTKSTKFGSSFEITDFRKIEKMEMIQKMTDIVKFKESRALAASDGKKTKKVKIDKLEDAGAAGGRNSDKCSLILTEGDSAKTFAISGLKPKDREYYGIFPLKGKLLNVREATANQLQNNEEIKNLKQILGLQNGKTFDSLSDLKRSMRYNNILILTDQDVDGSHIKGLLINFFHFFWPQLILEDTFVTCLQTPIVKAIQGKKQKIFYNIPEYKKWKTSEDNKWKIKYYKGLGTSTSTEAKECFENLLDKLVYYNAKKPEDEDAIKLAFQKDMADRRKEWIQENSGKNVYLDNTLREVSVKQFVDEELVQFSIYDCERSIPSIMDGFKPSQRKVFYGIRKKNTLEEIKVDQLRGYIGEHTAYHHGDKSLNDTIIAMAHNFVGSNNINLLEPCGQFGTRLVSNGADAASARYISTRINRLTEYIFNKDDDRLLEYLNEDGFMIEPKYFWPCIPMVLVNGVAGIGTGYSTDIPNYNPRDIIRSIKGLIADPNYAINKLTPWYKNFKGNIAYNKKKGNYISTGLWSRLDRTTIEIKELPIGVWTENYKVFLDKLEDDPENNISDVKNIGTETEIHFQIKAPSNQIEQWIDNDMELFKLSGTIKMNITLFDENGKITIYDSVEEVLYKFYSVRDGLYMKRYNYLTETYEKEISETKGKVLFIQRIISNEIQVFRISKEQIVKQLEDQKFHKINESYEYLLNLKVYSFTKEQISKLEKELEDAEKKLKIHRNKKYSDLWLEDLSNLETHLDKVA